MPPKHRNKIKQGKDNAVSTAYVLISYRKLSNLFVRPAKLLNWFRTGTETRYFLVYTRYFLVCCALLIKKNVVFEFVSGTAHQQQ